MPAEVKYNMARALQLLGLNIGAAQLYEELTTQSEEICPAEIRTRAIFNLSQLYKGSGFNSGISIQGLANNSSTAGQVSTELKKDRIHDLKAAHSVCMKLVI